MLTFSLSCSSKTTNMEFGLFNNITTTQQHNAKDNVSS